jgi:hypothetical protein
MYTYDNKVNFSSIVFRLNFQTRLLFHSALHRPVHAVRVNLVALKTVSEV